MCCLWQDWFAFLGNGSDFNFTLAGEAFFPNSGGPTANDNYGFCKVLYVDKQHSITTVQLSLNLYDSIRLSSLVP